MARPKGRKDSKPRKKKSIKKKKSEKKQDKRQPPEITPYPKAGDNPEFEGLLDRADLEEPQKKQPPKVELPPGEQFLSAKDVTEWVQWPFASWAVYNKMPQLKISDTEALSIAEPLTNILNRHGVGELIPPDMLDGLKIAGRLTPIMSERFKAIKAERLRRHGAAQDAQAINQADASQGGRTSATNEKQGAPFRKPEKVSH